MGLFASVIAAVHMRDKLIGCRSIPHQFGAVLRQVSAYADRKKHGQKPAICFMLPTPVTIWTLVPQRRFCSSTSSLHRLPMFC